MLESHTLSIAEVFEAMCTCTQGKPIPNGRYEKAFGDVGAPHAALIIKYSQDSKQKTNKRMLSDLFFIGSNDES